MAFAEKLKQLMQGAGLTQAQLSALTGIGRPSISQYLSGKNEPAKERRKQIAKSLGVQEDYFEQFLPTAEIKDNPAVNLPVPLAAKLMGKSPAWVCQGLKDGVFPWGYAVKLGRWSYFISVIKFEEFTGIKVPVKEGRNAACTG